MLTVTNTITRKPKDKITVILLHRMSNGTLIQMSSHEKNIATTIEKSIYARVAKRVKQIPPLNRNIDFAEYEVAAILKSPTIPEECE